MSSLGVERLGDRQHLGVGVRGRELELHRVPARQRSPARVADVSDRKSSETRVAAEEGGHADEEQTVAAGALELAGLEGRRRPILVQSLLCLLRVQRRDAGSLTPQVLDRAIARVVLEEPEGDRRRDEAGESDAGEEEGRQSEAEGPEHPAPLDRDRLLGWRDLVADAPDRDDR